MDQRSPTPPPRLNIPAYRYRPVHGSCGTGEVRSVVQTVSATSAQCGYPDVEHPLEKGSVFINDDAPSSSSKSSYHEENSGLLASGDESPDSSGDESDARSESDISNHSAKKLRAKNQLNGSTPRACLRTIMDGFTNFQIQTVTYQFIHYVQSFPEFHGSFSDVADILPFATTSDDTGDNFKRQLDEF